MKSAFALKGSLFTLTIMQLQDPHVENILMQLRDVMGQTPKFFQRAPIILDLHRLLDPGLLNLPQLIVEMRALGLFPVGLTLAKEELFKNYENLGLAYFPLTRDHAGKIRKKKVAERKAIVSLGQKRRKTTSRFPCPKRNSLPDRYDRANKYTTLKAI